MAADNTTTGGTSTSTNTLTNSANTAIAPDTAIQTNSGLSIASVSGGTTTINESDEGAIQDAFGFAEDAAQQEATTAAGALQQAGGLATQGTNLASLSNPAGAIGQILKPVAIIVAIIVVGFIVYYLFN